MRRQQEKKGEKEDEEKAGKVERRNAGFNGVLNNFESTGDLYFNECPSSPFIVHSLIVPENLSSPDIDNLLN